MQLTLSLVARKQTLGTVGSEDMVRVIMVVERGAKEDWVNLKLCLGFIGKTVVEILSGTTSWMTFLVVSYYGNKIKIKNKSKMDAWMHAA